MKRRIAFSVFAGIALVAAGAVAACPQNPAKTKTHTVKTKPAPGDCVDLNGVPQISEQIIAAEPRGMPVKKPAYTPPESTRYEGPTLGLSKLEPGVKPAPTVGYHWSLD